MAELQPIHLLQCQVSELRELLAAELPQPLVCLDEMRTVMTFSKKHLALEHHGLELGVVGEGKRPALPFRGAS